MKRDLYTKLLAWKISDRRKPLILQGARQVGKTYLLREFGENEYTDFAYYNFDEDPGLDELFRQKLDPEFLIERLSNYRNKKIQPEKTLIFFDEVQESGGALNSLKYFSEKAGHYHIVSAGSLLGIKLSSSKPFPVGNVNFLMLYPMTFFEFLNAVGKPNLRDLLEKQNSLTALASTFHNELIEILKTYYFVGGLPEAVLHYTTTRDLIAVREIHREILKAYTLDFSKHAPKDDVMKISQIWSSIPAQLARENKKFTFSAIGKTARMREYENALQWLVDSGTIYKSYNISIPGVPLDGYAEKNIFKVFFLDVGLLGAMTDLTPKTLTMGNELFTHFKGAFVENYAAQELTARHEKQLYYWTSKGMAEVDFILPVDEEIYPLEVKSGMNMRSRSLGEYGRRYNPPFLSRVTQHNFGMLRGIHNYPLYAVSLFPAVSNSGA